MFSYRSHRSSDKVECSSIEKGRNSSGGQLRRSSLTPAATYDGAASVTPFASLAAVKDKAAGNAVGHSEIFPAASSAIAAAAVSQPSLDSARLSLKVSVAAGTAQVFHVGGEVCERAANDPEGMPR